MTQVHIDETYSAQALSTQALSTEADLQRLVDSLSLADPLLDDMPSA